MAMGLAELRTTMFLKTVRGRLRELGVTER
jgi:hypothetical protein